MEPLDDYKKYCDKQNARMLSRLRVPHEKCLSQNDYSFPVSQNIVVTVSIGCTINPRQIVSNFLMMEYKPCKFAAVVMRISDLNSRTTVLVFATGKIVCVGGKSIEEVRLQLQKYRRILSNLGYPTNFTDLKLHNRVCNGDVGYPINLQRMSDNEPLGCVYNPNDFPGLIRFVMLNNTRNVIFLIFDTGKFIVMGLREDGEEIVSSQKVLPTIAAYREHRTLSTSAQRNQNRIQACIKKMSKEDEKKLFHDINITKPSNLKQLLQQLADKSTRNKSQRTTTSDTQQQEQEQQDIYSESFSTSSNNKSTTPNTPEEEHGVISRRKRRKKEAVDNDSVFKDILVDI